MDLELIIKLLVFYPSPLSSFRTWICGTPHFKILMTSILSCKGISGIQAVNEQILILAVLFLYIFESIEGWCSSMSN